MIVQNRTWKVGELSKLAGLTIRTLHHYDEIGLLSPTFRTDSGHRLYAEDDIVKLQQIMSLKELDFSLDEIKEFFENPEYNPKEIIEMQIERLNQEIKLKEELMLQLQELWEVFNSLKKPNLEQFISSIQLIKNQKDYFTQEQINIMKKQYGKLNNIDSDKFAYNWNEINYLLQSEMEKGTSVYNPRVIELVKRWKEEMDFFTGGDSGIMHSAERYYTDNPHAAKGSGMSGELYKYIKDILSHIK
ncbi:MerR family transcriptional regulator [Clostridium swellfunianum]|uniref:MerR family transcriptional regulator n=1 Tax=Clostridium swellfunianum TaxID=1367462 RepID=UPI00202ED803|nr:MerR family transcriptional regulator [Clostridium swellfunianum]MCM0651001.1 MerR family transcriptional regulator [Clostridium swellfunianum]